MIRTQGAFGERIGEGSLANALESYASGDPDPETVTAALVRERIVHHSPTFDFSKADPDKLLKLVAECSEDPKFDSTEPRKIADALVRARDADIETLRETQEHIAASVRDLVDSTMSPIGRDLERLMGEQQQALAAAASAILPSRHIAEMVKTTFAATGLAEQFARSIPAELLATIPKIEMPAIDPGWLASMALPDYSDLFRSAVNIDATYYANLLKMSREVATSYTLSAALTDLLSRPKFEVGEMFEVAKATAAFAEQEGAGAEAEILAEATAEAEAVARNPTQEDLLVAVQRLHERIDENERQRREDRRDDMTRNDVLLAYTLLYTFYIALYFYLLGLYKP